MKKVNTDDIIEAGVRSALGKDYSKDKLDQFKKLLANRKFKDARGNYVSFEDILTSVETNKELESLVEKSLSSDEFKIFKSIMGAAEKEFDGTAVLNSTLIRGAKTLLEQRKEELEEAIRAGGDTQSFRAQLSQVEDQLGRINKAMNNMYQITGRGQVGSYGIKTAFEVADLENVFGSLFRDVGFVIGRSGLKRDIDLAQDSTMIAISGLGRSGEKVYLDPVSAAFHQSVFASPDELRAVRQYADDLTAELRTSVESNVLPQKVLRYLQQTAEETFDYLPVTEQASALRNREFARKIIELHQSGIGPRQSPMMMNMLHAVYASEAFKVQRKRVGDRVVETYLPAMPNTFRFALGSESAEAMRGLSPILGSYKGSSGRAGFDSITYALDGANQTSELLKFRVNNHKLLMHAGAVEEFYNALGGFDLDDKGLPKMMTTVDEYGKKDLMFGLYRQPSGPKEIIYASAALDDIHTFRALFGNEQFIEGLSSIAAPGSKEEKLLKLLQEKHIDPNMHGRFADTVDAKGAPKLKIGPRSARESLDLSNITEQEVKDIVMDVYDNVLDRPIAQASEQTLRYMKKYGASAYMFTDIPHDVTGKFGDETMSSMDIYNIKRLSLQEALREGLIESDKAESTMLGASVRKLLVEDETRLRSLLGNTLFDDLMTSVVAADGSIIEEASALRSIVSANVNNKTLEALIQTAAMDMMAVRSTAEGSDILGVFVNRAMVVGSTLRQTEDFLEKLGSGADADLLRKYVIGLGSQEFAIDRAVNFTLEQRFFAETAANVAASIGLGHSQAALAAALAARGVIDSTVGEIGEAAIKTLGKRLGMQVSIYESRKGTVDALDEMLRPVIDKKLLEGRLTPSGDIPNLIEGIISGITDYMNANSLSIDQMPAEIQRIVSSLSEVALGNDKAVDFLMQEFGAGGSHEYASLAAGDALARQVQAEREVLKKLSRQAMERDNILLSNTGISKEAEEISKSILDRYKKELDFLSESITQDFSDTHLAMRSIIGEATGDNLLSDLQAASARSGLSVEELINAMQKRSAQGLAKFPLENLLLSGEGEDQLGLLRRVLAVRVRRNADFYRRTMPTNVVDEIDTIRGAIAGTADPTMGPGRFFASIADIDSLDVAGRVTKQAGEDLLFESQKRQSAGYLIKRASEEAGFIPEVIRGRAIKLAESIAEGMIRDGVIESTVRSELEGLKAAIDDVMLLAAEDYLDPGIVSELRATAAPVARATSAPALDEAIDRIMSSAGSVTTAPTAYEKFSMAGLKDLFENNNLFRRSTYAVGALIAGSFAYSAFKDHTAEKIQGPPLLPGGSAYEENYPNRLPEIPQIGTINYNPGVSYKVNLYGNYNTVNSFRENAMELGNFDMNTTMYSRIPDVTRDPYQDIASSY